MVTAVCYQYLWVTGVITLVTEVVVNVSWSSGQVTVVYVQLQANVFVDRF